jgi:hypothetical protein
MEAVPPIGFDDGPDVVLAELVRLSGVQFAVCGSNNHFRWFAVGGSAAVSLTRPNSVVF